MMVKRGTADRKPLTPEQRAKRPPSVHPVFLTHPITGRKVLYCNPGYAVRINELDEAESDRVLDALFEHQLQHALPAHAPVDRGRPADLGQYRHAAQRHPGLRAERAPADEALPGDGRQGVPAGLHRAGRWPPDALDPLHGRGPHRLRHRSRATASPRSRATPSAATRPRRAATTSAAVKIEVPVIPPHLLLRRGSTTWSTSRRGAGEARRGAEHPDQARHGLPRRQRADRAWRDGGDPRRRHREGPLRGRARRRGRQARPST